MRLQGFRPLVLCGLLLTVFPLCAYAAEIPDGEVVDQPEEESQEVLDESGGDEMGEEITEGFLPEAEDPEVVDAPSAVSEGESSGGGDLVVTIDEPIETYTAYDAYYGSISTTYVEYMRGYLSKLTPQCHYVGARVGQYQYIFAYGEDLTYSGGEFTGAVNVATWNTYNDGSFSFAQDGSFRLDPGSCLVYSDLTEKYPSLATSGDFTLRQILILFTVFGLCLTIDHMYQVRKIRRLTRRGSL